MTSEVIDVLELKVSALGMFASYILAAPLGLLAFDQMLIVEMVVHNSWTAIYEGALFTRESLIADTIRTLRSTQEQGE
jgi:hypothetical protein